MSEPSAESVEMAVERVRDSLDSALYADEPEALADLTLLLSAYERAKYGVDAVRHAGRIEGATWALSKYHVQTDCNYGVAASRIVAEREEEMGT